MLIFGLFKHDEDICGIGIETREKYVFYRSFAGVYCHVAGAITNNQQYDPLFMCRQTYDIHDKKHSFFKT